MPLDILRRFANNRKFLLCIRCTCKEYARLMPETPWTVRIEVYDHCPGTATVYINELALCTSPMYRAAIRCATERMRVGDNSLVLYDRYAIAAYFSNPCGGHVLRVIADPDRGTDFVTERLREMCVPTEKLVVSTVELFAAPVVILSSRFAQNIK